jgi:formylglycine-generating enzyme required for sulfatase activity
VTQKQYETIMGANPSHTKGAENPVEFMSWQDAQKFCTHVAEKNGKAVRLPTEAEWEYACRAGTDTTWFWGNSGNDLGFYAWNKANAGGLNVSHPVATKAANQWGLYDMIGNVWQLVQDCDSIGYDVNDTTDPTGNKADVGIKIARGGSMNYGSDQCRTSYRLAQGLTVTLFEVGFRVAVDAKE